MASSATPASVGHRPVATTNAKKIEVSGELTTGSTLQIADVFIRDEDGDPLSLDKMNNADDIKWYLVDNEAADPSGTPAATGTAFTIPADAGGKKIKIVYRIKTATGTPDSAFLPATVLLTSASSGVGGDSAADGTISNKLRSVTINVVNESGKPTDELNGTNDATPQWWAAPLKRYWNVPPQRQLSVRSVIITLPGRWRMPGHQISSPI